MLLGGAQFTLSCPPLPMTIPLTPLHTKTVATSRASTVTSTTSFLGHFSLGTSPLALLSLLPLGGWRWQEGLSVLGKQAWELVLSSLGGSHPTLGPCHELAPEAQGGAAG